MARTAIIDCDPGHDDAMALLVALKAPELQLEAVTTVAGNQTIEKTTHNARRILTLAKAPDIPLASGMNGPLVGTPVYAPEVHGESGLDGVTLPDPSVSPVDLHAVEQLHQTLRHTNEAITLIALGPLTNIATLFSMYPEQIEQVEEIVIMGGSISSGNVTPVAEFNVFADPEAADKVFRTDVPIRMIGLEVTRKARVPASAIERFSALETSVGVAVSEMLTYLLPLHRRRYGWEAVPVHDICAVLAAVDSDLLEYETMNVDVECRGEHTRGQTVCDRRTDREGANNIEVGVDINAERLIESFYDRIAAY